MMLRRTSGNSSLSIWRNIGRRCEMVLYQVSISTWTRVVEYILVLSEYRGQPANLCAKRSSNMLGLIRNELFYARHDLVEKSLALE